MARHLKGETMECVIAEREFDQPIAFEDFRGIRARGAWCFDAYNIRYLGSHFATDGRRMICRYEAPDAESVREPSRKLDVPFERIWSATVHERPRGGDERPERTNGRSALVVVQRSFEQPRTFDDLEGIAINGIWCFQLHDVRLVRSFFSRDGRRMICIYDAPDAEAVRQTQRQIGFPFDRAWTATAFEPAH